MSERCNIKKEHTTSIHAKVKAILPSSVVKYLHERLPRPTRARKESNRWLRHHCKDIQGKVLSIGSGSDADHEGDYYRNYFPMASSYTTSKVSKESKSDLTLDVRSMPEINDESFDCIFCSGVLDHVDHYQVGFDELTRILKTGGILALGLPSRQAIHMSPQDFRRFTEHGIKHLLRKSYEIIDMVSIDTKRGMELPSAYWVKARKTGGV